MVSHVVQTENVFLDETPFLEEPIKARTKGRYAAVCQLRRPRVLTKTSYEMTE